MASVDNVAFWDGFRDCAEEAVKWLVDIEKVPESDSVIVGLREYLKCRKNELLLNQSLETEEDMTQNQHDESSPDDTPAAHLQNLSLDSGVMSDNSFNESIVSFSDALQSSLSSDVAHCIPPCTQMVSYALPSVHQRCTDVVSPPLPIYSSNSLYPYSEFLHSSSPCYTPYLTSSQHTPNPPDLPQPNLLQTLSNQYPEIASVTAELFQLLSEEGEQALFDDTDSEEEMDEGVWYNSISSPISGEEFTLENIYVSNYGVTSFIHDIGNYGGQNVCDHSCVSEETNCGGSVTNNEISQECINMDANASSGNVTDKGYDPTRTSMVRDCSTTHDPDHATDSRVSNELQISQPLQIELSQNLLSDAVSNQ